MKIIYLLLIALSPIFAYSQVLKFQAIKVQVVLNDKYGNYMMTGQEIDSQDGRINIELNFNNQILHIANKEAGDFNIKSIIEHYADTLSQSWTILQCIDKDGATCMVRLSFTPKDNLYDAYLYIDYKPKVIVYKLVKDPTK